MNLMNNFNLSEKFRNLPLKTKKVFAITSVAIFVAVVVIGAIIFKFQEQEALRTMHYDEEIGTIMSHGYLIDYNFVRGASKAMRKNIDSVVLSDEEKQSAPRENKPSDDLDESVTEIVIDEETFITERSYEQPTYSFNLNVSDGRIYKVYLHSDVSYGIEYIATVMYRIDTDNQKSFAFINSHDSESEQLMLDWIKGLNIKNPTIKKDNLEVL